MLTSIRWFLNKSVNEVFVSKVNTAHQTKLEELKAEISEVDRKSSENCVVSSSIPFHLCDKVLLKAEIRY